MALERSSFSKLRMNKFRVENKVLAISFYTLSLGKFHNRGYSYILYGINSIDIMGCCTPEYMVHITWLLYTLSTTLIRTCPYRHLVVAYINLSLN